MNGSLQDTLDAFLRSGSTSNPGLNALLADYTRYHVVFIVVGVLFFLAFALLGTFSWRRFTRTPKSDNRKWSFERVTYFCFGASSVVLDLMMAVIVAANVSNVLDPRQGFSGAVGTLGTPGVGTPNAELQQAFTEWLQSGRTGMPSLIVGRINDRLAWQRPKAIICSTLLVVFVLLGARLWRTLIKSSRTRQGGWNRKDMALFSAGVVVGPACVLLMLMVIGNAQGSLAPISLTLFYG